MNRVVFGEANGQLHVQLMGRTVSLCGETLITTTDHAQWMIGCPLCLERVYANPELKRYLFEKENLIF